MNGDKTYCGDNWTEHEALLAKGHVGTEAQGWNTATNPAWLGYVHNECRDGRLVGTASVCFRPLVVHGLPVTSPGIVAAPSLARSRGGQT